MFILYRSLLNTIDNRAMLHLLIIIMIIIDCVLLICFRLEAYDRNANFSDQPLIAEIWTMNLPASSQYRDVTGNTKLPPISSVTVQEYLMPFGTALDKHPRKLYNDRYAMAYKLWSSWIFFPFMLAILLNISHYGT